MQNVSLKRIKKYVYMNRLDKKLKDWKKVWDRFVCNVCDNFCRSSSHCPTQVQRERGAFVTVYEQSLYSDNYHESKYGDFTTTECNQLTDLGFSIKANFVKYINNKFTFTVLQPPIFLTYISLDADFLYKDSKTRRIYNSTIIRDYRIRSIFKANMILSESFKFDRSHKGNIAVYYGRFKYKNIKKIY